MGDSTNWYTASTVPVSALSPVITTAWPFANPMG